MLQDVYSGWHGPWTLAKELQYRLLWTQLAAVPRTLTAEERNRRFLKLYDLDWLRFARLGQYLRLRRPAAVVGYSVFIYRLSAEETNTVAFGSMAELAELMERALQTPGTSKANIP